MGILELRRSVGTFALYMDATSLLGGSDFEEGEHSYSNYVNAIFVKKVKPVSV